MGFTVEDVLMAAGSWSGECEYDVELAKALVDEFGESLLPGPHLLLYWGEELWHQGPVLTARIDHRGIHLAGRGLIYWLGSGSDGPIIVDRDYLAGTNRLGNGDFELGELYWSFEELTKWVIGAGGPVHQGTQSAVMSAAAAGGDDVLSWGEAIPARSGQQWQAQAMLRLVSGTAGGVRLRVIFEGQFRPANLLANADFSGGLTGWTATTNTFGSPAAAVVSGQLRLGPVPQRQVITNPKFDLNIANWTLGDGPSGAFYLDDQNPFSPAYSMSTAETPVGSKKSMWTAITLGSGPGGLIQPGERYRLDCNILPTPTGVDGTAYAAVDYYRPDGEGNFEGVRAETQHVRGTDDPGTWRNVSVEFDSDTYQQPLVWLFVFDHTNEFWSFDDVYLTRIVGNEVQVESGTMAVTPGLAYNVKATVQSVINGQAGSVILRMRLSGSGRPDLTVPVASTEHTGGQPFRLEGSFTPPSGYDVARLQIVGKDILGTYFSVDDVDVRQADAGVIVKDNVRLAATAGAGFNALITVPALTPAGTDSVRVAIVAEDGTAWAVDNVALNRLSNGSIPSTGVIKTTAEIVGELLIHPDTGLPLLDEGTIVGADTLVYDWRVSNLTDRAALDHLSRSGVASPTREWRVHAAGRLDWGTTAQIFEERDLVFAGRNLLVLSKPEVEVSAEGRVERVKVIGAERRAPNGDRFNIEGEAENASAGTDFKGNPVMRTRLVTDSQVDHPGYAGALARHQADEANDAAQSMRVQISDWSAEQPFDVGDTVGLFKPEAGVFDPDEEHVGPRGEVTHPVRRRVLARTTRCGQGFRAELRLPDGTTLPLKVRWEEKTSADLEIGAFRREFLNDPQGGPAGVQFMRYRASMPR